MNFKEKGKIEKIANYYIEQLFRYLIVLGLYLEYNLVLLDVLAVLLGGLVQDLLRLVHPGPGNQPPCQGHHIYLSIHTSISEWDDSAGGAHGRPPDLVLLCVEGQIYSVCI